MIEMSRQQRADGGVGNLLKTAKRATDHLSDYPFGNFSAGKLYRPMQRYRTAPKASLYAAVGEYFQRRPRKFDNIAD